MIASGTAWGGLVGAALVGTERRSAPEAVAAAAALVGVDDPARGGDPGEAGERLDLLTAAGIVAACRRCCLRPVRDEGPPPAPAGPDPRPEAPPAASDILGLLLGAAGGAGGGVAALDHWLRQCAATGHRVPGRAVPALLDLATGAPELRAGALAAGGTRLVWLAGHGDRWSWAAGDAGGDLVDAEAIWRTADRAGRFALLRRLREADPARAAALVAETWRSEAARDRAEILGVLATGAGPADEALLEAALDDRSKPVRRSAAALLAALPASQLAARMAGRIRAMLPAGTKRAGRLALEPPEELDPAAARDGIVADPPAGTGRRAWWLLQLVAAAPLDVWTDELSGSPEEVVARADQPELLEGWALAALRQRRADWAEALLRRGPTSRDGALAGVLRPGAARGALAVLVHRRADEALVPLLAAVPGPWPRPLVETVAARIRAVKDPPFRAACVNHLTAADPVLAEDLAGWLAVPGATDYERGAIDRTVGALAMRRAISEAFA